jgi:hypothetical protein
MAIRQVLCAGGVAIAAHSQCCIRSAVKLILAQFANRDAIRLCAWRVHYEQVFGLYLKRPVDALR